MRFLVIELIAAARFSGDLDIRFVQRLRIVFFLMKRTWSSILFYMVSDKISSFYAFSTVDRFSGGFTILKSFFRKIQAIFLVRVWYCIGSFNEGKLDQFYVLYGRGENLSFYANYQSN